LDETQALVEHRLGVLLELGRELHATQVGLGSKTEHITGHVQNFVKVTMFKKKPRTIASKVVNSPTRFYFSNS
jgi:hypothetical protein